jgi:parallel beta-helix repeat protein
MSKPQRVSLVGAVFVFLASAAAQKADAVVYTVSNTNDSGAGSLRQAILDANASVGGTDDINFTVAGTITLQSALPSLQGSIRVNGNTAPGFVSAPLVAINGNGLAANGLELVGSNHLVRALVIRNFAGDGIVVGSIDNVVRGCWVGMDLTGSAASSNTGNGIEVTGSANTIDANVVSGNHEVGILVSGSEHVVTSNRIGTTASGVQALGNGNYGLKVLANSTTVGSPGLGNVISANVVGLSLEGNGNVAVSNVVGTNAAGTTSIGSQSTGIEIWGDNNIVGGPSLTNKNIVSGNAYIGVRVFASASGTHIRGNYIGLNATGTAAVPNDTIGVYVSGAASTTVGGSTTDHGNVISGNGSDGVRVDANATGTLILRNSIGTNPAGTAAIPNAGAGILVGAGGTSIGNGGENWNLISGNTGHGIVIDSSNNVVKGNRIGTNLFGTNALGNGSAGILFLSGSGNTVGGPGQDFNLISGNHRGISLTGTASGNTIRQNFIGTTFSGDNDLGNNQTGVEVFTDDNTIGGAFAGNVISGNGAAGIWLRGGADGNTISGNRIGVMAVDPLPLPNLYGIVVETGFDTQIGGTAGGLSNVIAENFFQGIHVKSGTGHSIVGNQMFGNGRLGIDLDPVGVNADDPNDLDFGPNLRQNAPVLTQATINAGLTTVNGQIKTAPNRQMRIDFYGNAACHPSGIGEGEVPIGSTTLSSTASGLGTFSPNLVTGTPGSFVTATAVEIGTGNTSEFSACVATFATTPKIQLSTDFSDISEYEGNAVITVTRSADFGGTVGVHYATSNGTASAPGDYTHTQGDLSFGATDTVKKFLVPIVFDMLTESPEQLTITLSAPTGGATLGVSSAQLRIFDSDRAFPSISFGDAVLAEGTGGTRTMSFPVTVSPHTGPVSLAYQTVDGTAVAGQDYVAASGPLNFTSIESQKNVSVTITSDAQPEPDEIFFLRVTAQSTSVADNEGEGVIVDDDVPGAPGGLRGDANGNLTVDVADVFYLINALFAGGSQAVTTCRGDANADAAVTVADVFFLISYLYAGGPAPAPPC